MERPAVGRGQLIATIQAGAWRSEPPPVAISPAELAEVTPALVDTRSAALAWWRLRRRELASCPAAAVLQDAYRFHALEATWRERDLSQVIGALHGAGVQPLLAKGWALARSYPRAELRPYLDLDLAVHPQERARAAAVLASLDGLHTPVDLHAGFGSLPDRTWAELEARAQAVPLESGGDEVTVLGPEDHLRLVSRHFAKHGGRRPIWLCDVAVLLESLAPTFDWDWCLHGQAAGTAWVVTVVRLAHQLLGARLPDVPALQRTAALPTWLIPAVLRAWGSHFPLAQHRPVAEVVTHPARLLWTVRERWPNQLAGTACSGVGPVAWPLPFQFIWYLWLSAGWAGRLPHGGAGSRPLPLGTVAR